MIWLVMGALAVGATAMVLALVVIVDALRELLFGWFNDRQAQRQRDQRLLQLHEDPPEDWDGSSPLQ